MPGTDCKGCSVRAGLQEGQIAREELRPLQTAPAHRPSCRAPFKPRLCQNNSYGIFLDPGRWHNAKLKTPLKESCNLRTSIRDSHQQYLLPSIPVLVMSPSTSYQDCLCDQWNKAEMMLCHFQGWLIKDTAASALLFPSWVTLGKASCYATRTLKCPYEEGHVAGN
ncbi:PREDICTED: retinol-binding protein 5 isoform X2 [Cercocebus atys]|uniref:retinol-binding protein 5 isoform X2 n=1 Tax=Cercocebus atys TaxID=9531 RepID=UPI0005F49F6D|nr:PREDICTED: retinol-binding protein 5 isoform X2 [Cercocebus atys]